MKQIDVALWELTKSDIMDLTDSMQVLVYNTFSKTYRVMRAKLIKRFFYTNYVYITFTEPKFKRNRKGNE